MNKETPFPINVSTLPEMYPTTPPPSSNKEILELTFTVTHYILLFALFVSIITCFLVDSPKKRLIFYLECGITLVSSTIYIIFSKSIIDNHSAADTLQFLFGFSLPDPIQNINTLRYVGWTFSTALMLCALCLILALNLKITAPASILASVVVLDWIMLAFGFLGETGSLDKTLAFVLGFIPFFAMFYVVYNAFIEGRKNVQNQFIFWIYFTLWIGYGLVYLSEVTFKTIVTNILDCVAKAFFAIGLSAMYLS